MKLTLAGKSSSQSSSQLSGTIGAPAAETGGFCLSEPYFIHTQKTGDEF